VVGLGDWHWAKPKARAASAAVRAAAALV